MEELIKKCKCGVYLEVNRYRDYYHTIVEAIESENTWNTETVIDTELSNRMMKENMFISLQFYPDTPVGFYKVYGTSLAEVVEKAFECIEYK